MSLAEYAASWVVRRHFGSVDDPARPIDMPLGAADRTQLAGAMVTDVAALQLQSADGKSVMLDGGSLTASCADWSTVFDVREALLANARRDGEAPDKAARQAFASFILARWIFRLVWHVDVFRNPLDRSLPPNYDSGAKQVLENLLTTNVVKVGLLVTDPAAVHKTVAKWDLVSDVTKPFIQFTSSY